MLLQCRKNFVLIVICVFFSETVFGQYDEGEECETRRGLSGICRFITQCPSAIDDIRRGIYPSDICGYIGTQSIICCVPRSTTRPTQTQTPISTKPQVQPTPKPVVPPSQPITKPSTVGNNPGDKAKHMCEFYSQYAYEKIDSSALSLITSFSTELVCPISTEKLIVGGTDAGRREFPHMVQIGFITGSETTWNCGGSLISEYFVLTAGHCLASSFAGNSKLVRGGITRQTDTQHLQVRNIVDRIKHPSYDFHKYNDIGLIKVDQPFTLNTYLRPACVNNLRHVPTKHAIASGWGKTAFAGEESQRLLKVTLEFFTTEQCNKTYRRQINQGLLSRGIDEDIMICAGSSVDKKDTCQGDSGGPLQIILPDTDKIKCMYSIIAITSFGGQGCGLDKNLPAVYTRVSAYLKWIEDTVWP